MSTFLALLLVAVLAGVDVFFYRKMQEELHKMNANFQTLQEALAALQTDVANEDTVIDGAVTLINGFAAQIQAAVQAALAAGAPKETLAAFSTLADEVNSKASALAAAVASAPSGTVQPGPGVTNPAPTGTPGG
jgi:murein L,D-transpeptidase YcbB/YkuD